MKHLHLQFVLASAAFGMGGVFLFGAVWSIHALPLSGWTPIRTFLSATLSSLAGAVMVWYGWHGIRKEIYAQEK